MTTRYRIEYALKSHRRDQFIEWIKALLGVPFIIHSQPTGVFDTQEPSIARMAAETHRRYAETFKDVEQMIDDHIKHQKEGNPLPSKLKFLVPAAGPFFTRLPLEAAFKYQDAKRCISSRRYVAPSFNDVRLILNSAQIMAVAKSGLQLATFDGDVTLYEDGQCLEPSSPIIPRLLDLLRKNIKIGIVTAAGYTTADRYYERLHGLLDAVANAVDLTSSQKRNLIIMGGEANYLFEFHPESQHRLSPVPLSQWLTPEMAKWSEDDIKTLLDVAEAALLDCVKNMNLPAVLIRKERAVGIVPETPDIRIPRESLEETVLVLQKVLELSAMGYLTHGGGASPRNAGGHVPFCAFNGGRDVFVDIGDKSWGVTVCQRWFGSCGPDGDVQAIAGENTLHVGDQFLSAGSNDFKARSVGTTAWIAGPLETVQLLDEIADVMTKKLD